MHQDGQTDPTITDLRDPLGKLLWGKVVSCSQHICWNVIRSVVMGGGFQWVIRCESGALENRSNTLLTERLPKGLFPSLMVSEAQLKPSPNEHTGSLARGLPDS